MFTLLDSFGTMKLIMAEGQIKSKGQRIAPGCHHFTSKWDSHHYCWSCRDKKKGYDVCVTSKEEDCYVCIRFSSEQKKKLEAKKAYQLKKSKDISKDLEDSLLGPEETPSTTQLLLLQLLQLQLLVLQTSLLPLMPILERLDSMQGRLSALEKGSTSVSSNEVNMTEATPTEGSDILRTSSHNVFAVTEEEEATEEYWEARTKRAHSLSPSSDVILPIGRF